jgi:hypothetical protein
MVTVNSLCSITSLCDQGFSLQFFIYLFFFGSYGTSILNFRKNWEAPGFNFSDFCLCLWECVKDSSVILWTMEVSILS